MLRRLLPLLVCSLAAVLCQAVLAQESETGAADRSARIRDLLQNQRVAQELIVRTSEELQGEERRARTPLQLLALLARAATAGDLDLAASFLDLRYLPPAVAEYTPQELFRALVIVWQQQNIVDPSRLSDRPEGNLNDGLPEYRDLLGTVVKDNGEKVPIYLQRIPDGEGGKVWKISNASVARIPELWQDLGYGPVGEWLQRHLPNYRVLGMQSWQLIAAGLFLVISWPLAVLLAMLLRRLMARVWPQYPIALANFFGFPVRLVLFLVIFRALTDQLALSLTTRVYLNSSGIDYLAFIVVALGLISLLRDMQVRRMERAGNRHLVALLRPFTTIFKFLLVIGVCLVWAERAGYNMSTILAGLGVGSLAVALAAQKTLENVIGAITLYAARPVNPGDLCRFGKVVGVVEEIGLRSTLIRTLDRTLLAVPNSMFSAVEVENFSYRDRIRYYRHIELQMTTADQLRVILGRLRGLFLSHAEVRQDTVSVRLEKVVAATAVIRIDAGIDTTDYQRYLAVAEDLNLRIIEHVHEAGAVFSGPGQVLQLREFQQADDEQMSSVEEQLARWQSAEDSPFPDYSQSEKARLQGQIELPGA